MRKLALLLLCDEYGIKKEAWDILEGLLEKEGNNKDIINCVECSISTDSRCYLPGSFCVGLK